MRLLSSIALIVVIPLIAGCGGASRPADMPETAPCSITVLQSGSPVSDVVVTLFLEGGNPSLVARGTTNSSGIATIKTSLGAYTTSGAPVGKCKVTLDKEFAIPPSSLTPDQVSDLSFEQAEKYNRERKEALDKARIIPEKIASVALTPLSLTVASGSEGTLTVDLSEYTK